MLGTYVGASHQLGRAVFSPAVWLASNGDDLTDDTDEIARERKRREAGKCEGRKSHAELNPELVALVRQLRRRRPKGGQRSLRDISAELADRGYVNERGRQFSAASIAAMLAARPLVPNRALVIHVD